MKTYFEAYRERMERNEVMLLNFAKELKAKGFKVYRYGTYQLLSGYSIRKDGKHISLYFCEVPYRWTLGISWKPNRKNGSGRTLKEYYDIDKIPFTVEEMEKLMYPDYNGQWKNDFMTEI